MELLTLNVPRIGEVWEGQGGVYVGIVRDEKGQMSHLIRGPQADDLLDHEDATKFATEQTVDGHTDFTLPTRRELSLLKANDQEVFRTDDWYWSCERHPEYERDAYAQLFKGGRQDTCDTGRTCYGCAVRRIPI